MALCAFNLAAELNSCKPPQYLKISELRPEESYLVIHLRKTTSRFGSTVAAILENAHGDLFTIYLPRKYLKVLSNDIVQGYNNSDSASGAAATKRLSVTYKRSTNDLEFVEIE